MLVSARGILVVDNGGGGGSECCTGFSSCGYTLETFKKDGRNSSQLWLQSAWAHFSRTMDLFHVLTALMATDKENASRGIQFNKNFKSRLMHHS